MCILVISDTWTPQINGVVRTYQNLRSCAERKNINIELLSFDQFSSVPCPTYPELHLTITSPSQIEKRLGAINPRYVHIATEGPLGAISKIALKRLRIPYTTSYHSRFPEYVAKRFFVGRQLTYRWQRHFHNSSLGTMVRSRTIRSELTGRRFNNLMPWVGGVDASLFQPRDDRIFGSHTPVFLYVGRIAIEKNLSAFLSLKLPGLKVIVGNGPAKAALQRQYPDAIFHGAKTGEELARCYSSADVFVFPSVTDTYGLTILEAMAAGLPVAAFPVAGPLDIVIPGVSGCLDWDLRKACLAALDLNRDAIRPTILGYTWENCLRAFLSNIQTANESYV
jgi:glycosyltransferase involved in cell wall biosynthesis